MNKILEKIETDKEVLSTIPRNNKKNIAKYIQALQELQEEYNNVSQEVYDELNKRYKKILSVKTKRDIEEERAEIE